MIPEVEERLRAEEVRRVVLAYIKDIMESKGVPWIRCDFSPVEGIRGGITVRTDKTTPFSNRCWQSTFYVRFRRLPIVAISVRFGPHFIDNVSDPNFEEKLIKWIDNRENDPPLESSKF